MCDKYCIQLANFIGKTVRPSRNNNSKGLATNNVSRETIGGNHKKNVSRETIIVLYWVFVFSLY